MPKPELNWGSSITQCQASPDRGGKTRVKTWANDHDFGEDSLVPFGILLPMLAELFLYFSTSRLTSDFIVDCLEQWWSSVRERFAHIRTLVINQDNGPENHSRRTQFLKRIVEFAHKYHLNIRLAYYPPYYSKYNPIERTWGVLEKHSLWQSLRRGRDSPQFCPDHDLERQAPYGDFD